MSSFEMPDGTVYRADRTFNIETARQLAGDRKAARAGGRWETARRLGVSEDLVAVVMEEFGCRFDEIDSVTDTPDGLVVSIMGAEFLDRPADRPDARGASGWLRYRPGRAGDRPLFARPATEGPPVGPVTVTVEVPR